MKQLSSGEVDDGLSLLAGGPALNEAFDGCTIVSRDIAWAWSRCRVADFVLSGNEEN